MGPLFVLLFWGVIGTIGGLVLASGAFTLKAGSAPHARLKAAGFLFLVPFAFLFWSALAVVIFTFWSILTGIDTGIGFGESRDLRLGYNYEIAGDFGSIYARDNPEALVSRVQMIAQNDSFVYGRAEKVFFILNTEYPSLFSYATEAEYLEQLSRRGLSNVGLVPLDEFYSGRDLNIADYFVILLLIIFPFVALRFAWIRYFTFVPSTKASDMGAI